MQLTRFALCLILVGSVWVVPNAITASQFMQGEPMEGLGHTAPPSARSLDAAKNTATVRLRAQATPDVSQIPAMIADLRGRLATLDRRADPLGYTHLNLGRTQLTLGEWGTGTRWLEDAVSSFRQAVRSLPRHERPLEWASTHDALGKALSILGERQRDRQLLEDGVAALRLAVEGLEQDRPSEAWVSAQTNLGMALMNVARHGEGTQEVEQAVATYRLALEETPRSHALMLWAHIQSNLGYALWLQGTREHGGPYLEEAIASMELAQVAYREAGQPQREQQLERQIAQIAAMIEARRNPQ